MFSEALLTIAKTWMEPKCPTKEGRVNKCGTYTHIRILLILITNRILLSHKK